jgi:hypothetical protein
MLLTMVLIDYKILYRVEDSIARVKGVKGWVLRGGFEGVGVKGWV